MFSLLDTDELLRTLLVSKGWNDKSPAYWTSLRFYIKPCDAVAARMVTLCADSLRSVEVWPFEDETRTATYRALSQCSRLVHARVGEHGLPFLKHNARLQSIAVDSAFLDPEAELVYFSAFTSLRHLQRVMLQNMTREGLEIILMHSPHIKVLRLHCLSGTELQALEHARSLTSLSLLYFKEAFMPGLARALTGVVSTLTTLELEYARKKEGLGTAPPPALHATHAPHNPLRRELQCSVPCQDGVGTPCSFPAAARVQIPLRHHGWGRLQSHPKRVH